MSGILLPGFAEPVGQAQLCFRAILDALARPGRIHQVAGPLPPPPLAPATAAVLLTLLDQDTPTWLDRDCRAAADWVEFHCGVVFTDLSRATFAVAGTMPDLADLSAGSDAAPEESATLILQVPDLGQGRALHLAGPGLPAPARLLVSGLPDDFVRRWQANHMRFPRGVDMILCAGDRLAALPRSVTVS